MLLHNHKQPQVMGFMVSVFGNGPKLGVGLEHVAAVKRTTVATRRGEGR